MVASSSRAAEREWGEAVRTRSWSLKSLTWREPLLGVSLHGKSARRGYLNVALHLEETGYEAVGAVKGEPGTRIVSLEQTVLQHDESERLTRDPHRCFSSGPGFPR